MSNHFTHCTIVALATLGLASPLVGQARSSIDPSELDAAAAVRPLGNRETALRMLGTDEARKIAGRMGLSPPELAARVATLDEASLNLLAAQTGPVDRNLAGGANTVVISTTTIIIALLLIIILAD